MYNFKPMSNFKKLYLALIKLNIVFSITSIVSGILSNKLGSENSTFSVIFLLSIIFYALLIISFTIFEIIGAYRIAFNDKILHEGVAHITPGWTVGYYFIPIASLFKPYQSYKYFISEMAGDTSQKKSVYNSLILFWTFRIITSFIGNFFKQIDSNVGLILTVISSLIYLLCSYRFISKLYTLEEETIQSVSSVSELN